MSAPLRRGCSRGRPCTLAAVKSVSHGGKPHGCAATVRGQRVRKSHAEILPSGLREWMSKLLSRVDVQVPLPCGEVRQPWRQASWWRSHRRGQRVWTSHAEILPSGLREWMSKLLFQLLFVASAERRDRYDFARTCEGRLAAQPRSCTRLEAEVRGVGCHCPVDHGRLGVGEDLRERSASQQLSTNPSRTL